MRDCSNENKFLELKPLMVFENTWWSSETQGLIILLSRDRYKEYENKDLWKVAFSYSGHGSQVVLFTDEEILKCEYLGFLSYRAGDDVKLKLEDKKI